MRSDRLKSFLWVLPFFLIGFQPVGAANPASSPEGGEGGTAAPSGATEVARPRVVPPDQKKGEEREIIARMELLENLEMLENLDLFEDFFLVVKEDEE